MTQYNSFPPRYPNPHAPQYPPAFPPQPPGGAKRRIPWWGWVLIIGGGGIFLLCAGVFGLLVYIGSVSPDTKVYFANEIPAKYVSMAKDLDLLDAGEQMKFFYSDALTDIRDGFYFVTDSKVVVYQQAAAQPATVVPFDQIAGVDIARSDSWIVDSSIMLTLHDGSVVAFPLSVELDRDQKVYEAIQNGIGGAAVEGE